MSVGSRIFVVFSIIISFNVRLLSVSPDPREQYFRCRNAIYAFLLTNVQKWNEEVSEVLGDLESRKRITCVRHLDGEYITHITIKRTDQFGEDDAAVLDGLEEIARSFKTKALALRENIRLLVARISKKPGGNLFLVTNSCPDPWQTEGPTIFARQKRGGRSRTAAGLAAAVIVLACVAVQQRHSRLRSRPEKQANIEKEKAEIEV